MGEDFVDGARAMCLFMVCLQFFMLGAQAIMFYDLNGGNHGAAGYMAGLMLVVLVLRVVYCPPWLFTYPSQVFICTTGSLMPVPFLLLAIMHYYTGAPLRIVQPEYAKMKRKRLPSKRLLTASANDAQ